jgi:hypothetical protein
MPTKFFSRPSRSNNVINCSIKKANTPIPLELQMKLLILHSYVLVVKRIIKIEEHQDAAFLLNRVVKNLSQFPTNAVNILTTAVVESMRSELKGLAYGFAVNLVKAEYREQVHSISFRFPKTTRNVSRTLLEGQLRKKTWNRNRLARSAKNSYRNSKWTAPNA